MIYSPLAQPILINSQFTLNLSMSNEFTDTMELDSNTFESNYSRETVFTGSIRPLLTIAEHQSDDDDNKENRRPGKDSETACPFERDPTPMDHIDNERSLGYERTGKQDHQGNTADDRRPHLTLENRWSLWNSVMTMINTLAQSLLSANRWRTSLPPEL